MPYLRQQALAGVVDSFFGGVTRFFGGVTRFAVLEPFALSPRHSFLLLQK